MTLDSFITTNTGKGINTDGAYGNQCMDLMHAYCRDVLGLSDLSILASPDAKTVYLNFVNVKGHELFDKIDNTPTGVPLKGDIVFWGTGVGPAGHVAVFVQGDVNSFRSFDQNWPSQGYTDASGNFIGTGTPHVQNHPNYAGVLGWLRLKVVAPSVPMATITQAELDKIRADRDSNYNGWQTEKAKTLTLTEENKALRNNLAGRDSEIASLNKKLSDIKTIIG